MNGFNKPLQLIDFIKQKKQQFAIAHEQYALGKIVQLPMFFFSVCSVSLFLVQAAITMHRLYEMSNHFLVPGGSEVHEQFLTGKCSSNYNAAYYTPFGLSLNRSNYNLIKCSFFAR